MLHVFSTKDIVDYYDNTENHYRMFWKFERGLGLHYGVWTEGIKNLGEAILNTNIILANAGGITKESYVLDAGCGVGGSAICIAGNFGCTVTGITLSAKQVATATGYAEKRGVSHLASFKEMDYTKTTFPDNTFDFVWAIESMQTAKDKSLFLKEAYRVLKTGGKLLVGDCFKSYEYRIEDEKHVQIMFNGWAVADVVTSETFCNLGKPVGFSLVKEIDVTNEVRPSVNRLFLSGIAGMIGTFLYNTFVKKASYFSRVHYKTVLSQFFSYRKKLWKYKLLVLEK